MRVVQEPVEQRRDGGGVAQQLAPIVDGAIECGVFCYAECC
jgi:hypothetical protein